MRRAVGIVLAFAVALGACKQKDDGTGFHPTSREAGVELDAVFTAPDARVEARPTPTKIVASGDSSCAVMSDHSVRCWGRNDHGQLGDGTTVDATSPVQPAVTAVRDLVLANDTACAALDDGSVSCWGRISWQGGAHDTLKPTGLLGVRGVQQVFVLGDRACARVTGAHLVCWGNIDAKGRFSSASKPRVPTPVDGLDHVVALRADAALRDDGSVVSWGSDGVAKVRGLTNIVELAERGGAICGRTEAGAVMCVDAKLPCAPSVAAPPAPAKPAKPAKPTRKPGGKSKPAKGKPVAKANPTPPPLAAKPETEPVLVLQLPRARALAFDHGWCVVTTDGALQCGDGCGHLDTPWRGLAKLEEVAGHCARTATKVLCWGADHRVIDTIEEAAKASAIAVGASHACALREGAVMCWGANTHGQLGRGTTDPGPGAQPVAL